MLIVLVVLRHVLQYSVSDEGGILTNFIWAVQMPGFMLVSGYFSCRQVNNFKAGLRRIGYSAEHYALPFFAWFLLISVLLKGNFNRNIITALKALMLHVNAGHWFLWTVFVLSIVSAGCNIVYAIMKTMKTKVAGILSWCLLFSGVLALLATLIDVDFIGIKYTLYYAVFYGFGWLLKCTEKWWKQKPQKLYNQMVFVSLVLFLAIVFNYDLYHCDDGLTSISLRIVAGFSGNLVVFSICREYTALLEKFKLDKIGMYTLEIYVTHVNVVQMVAKGESLYTASGFFTFICSLTITVTLTVIIITCFRANSWTNFLFFGKRKYSKRDNTLCLPVS